MKSYLKIIRAYLLCKIESCKPLNIQFINGKKYAFVMLAADYNNLGDVAITKAQVEFLKNNLTTDYQIIIIPYRYTCRVYNSMKKHMESSSIITLIGGGNNGTLYEFIEAPRRFILGSFKNCKIVSFPQTVIFENNETLYPYKKRFIKLCHNCNNLTLVAREKKSFETYRNLVGHSTKILLTPDIVFTLACFVPLKGRKNQACFIFRDDKEKKMQIKKQEELKKWVKQLVEHCIYKDTCDVVINSDGEQVLYNYLNSLAENRLAITDRLHGMIFCYITGTPCVVIKNSNYKIESTYDCWLKDKQNYIYLIDSNISENEFVKICETLLSLNEIKHTDMRDQFRPLIEDLIV